jgi:hypothetical protein
MSEALSWAELAEHQVELLPARTVLSCGGGGHDGGDGDGDGGSGDFNLNENTNTNTNTATATATVIPEGGLLALLGLG